MTQQEENTLNEEIQEETISGEQDILSDENMVQEEPVQESTSKEDEQLKDRFSRLQADYDNFKKRTERDREDMVFFINSKTFGKILPRVDDLERILQNTPEDLRNNTLFSWIEALYKTLTRDIESLWVKPFISKGQKVDPERHDVMTQVPGEEGIIVDEFEKGYVLWERVLRHAKVVVGSGN